MKLANLSNVLRTRRGRSVGALLVVASLSLAFVLLSPPRKWQANQLPHNFRIAMLTGENSLSKPLTQAAAQAAITGWNAAITGDSSWVGAAPFTSTVNNNLGNQGFVNDGLSTISFEDPQNMLATGVLAATTTGFYTTSQTEVKNGTTFFRITDSDVVCNNGVDFTSFADADASGANGTQYDLGGILIHEVGHAIGFGHAPGEVTTMFASVGAQDFRKRDLDDDDITGGRFVYVSGYHPVTFPAGNQLVADSTFLGLSTTTFQAGSLVLIRIAVTDQNKNTATGASVTVQVTTPAGATLSGTGTVNASGLITFNTGAAQHGTYNTTVTNITKAGSTFNPNLGKRTDSATF